MENKVYVRLRPHSEYTGFSIYDGVYSSIEKAITDYIQSHITEIPVDDVIILTEKSENTTYVLLIDRNIPEIDINEIRDDFHNSPLKVCYTAYNAISGFAIREESVK